MWLKMSRVGLIMSRMSGIEGVRCQTCEQVAGHEALFAVMKGCILHKSPEAAAAYKMAVSSLLDNYALETLRGCYALETLFRRCLIT